VGGAELSKYLAEYIYRHARGIRAAPDAISAAGPKETGERIGGPLKGERAGGGREVEG